MVRSAMPACSSTTGSPEPGDSWWSATLAIDSDRTIAPMTVLDAVPDAMQRFHVPGVAVGVLRDGDFDVRTFGVTSVDNPLPVLPDTLFQIGSITKTITATALARLMEQGKVDLEAPVRT